MNDIATEMRALANEPIVTGPEGRALLRKGAAEIERLNEAKRRALQIADERSKENAQLRAELQKAETDGYNKGVRDMAQGCPVCREAALPQVGHVREFDTAEELIAAVISRRS